MGVKGLTTFVEENHRRFFRKEKLHDCPLVIDGFGLVYHLYFGAELDVKYGGELAELAEVADNFFTNLKECNIKPYVLFDGPLGDDKLPCVLTRLQDRVKDVQRILNGSTTRLLPIFCVDVLLYYLWSHNIPHAVSLVEADCEIAALANYLQCPVLSEDSDYFIYNIKNGYIPFRHFYWDNVWLDKSPRRKSIVCHKYHISRICNPYDVPEHVLPYVSIILGNDWIDTFKQLISNLPSNRSSSSQKQRRRKKSGSKIESILHWLSLKSDWESDRIAGKMLNSLPPDRRDITKVKIEMSLAMYLEKPDLSKTLHVLDIVEPVPGEQDEPYGEIKDLIRRRLAHPFTLNLLESRYIGLPVVMSDPMEPSPHTPASDIRSVLYRFVLRQFRPKYSSVEFLFIQEYDKVDMFYKKSRTVGVFTSLCPMCDQGHSIENGCKMTTLSLLRKILRLQHNVHLQNCVRNAVISIFPNVDATFLEYLDVLLMSTLFWVKKTFPKPDFILSMVLTIAWSINRSFHMKNAYITSSDKPHPHSPRKQPQNSPKRTDANPQMHHHSPSPSKMIGGGTHGAGIPFSYRHQPHHSRGVCPKAGGTLAVPSNPNGHANSSPGRSGSGVLVSHVSKADFLQLFGDHGIKTASGMRERIVSEFNVALLHSASQWLCIVNVAYLLHQVVDLPNSKFAMQEFFASSLLLHHVHTKIKRFGISSGNFDEDFAANFEILAGRLESVPSMKIMFQVFIDFLMQQ